jgi:hypothetical protein
MPTPPDDPDDLLDDDEDDLAPSPDELALIRRATPADAAGVDELILRRCTSRWQKAARVAGDALDEFTARFGHLPFVYVPMRLQALVERGELEAQGDVMDLRRAEVRVPSLSDA